MNTTVSTKNSGEQLSAAEFNNVAAAVNSKRDILIGNNDQSGTGYNLALSDALKRVRMANAAANTVTIPTNAAVAFPVGTVIHVQMTGAGVTTITGAGGVTLTGSGVLDALNNEARLVKISADAWTVTVFSPETNRANHTGTVPAAAVVTDPARQFITSAGLAAIASIISNYGQVATRAFFPNAVESQVSSETSATYRTRHAVMGKGSNLQLVYANTYVPSSAGEADVPGSISVSVRLVYNGVNIPVYFNGSRTATIEPGGMIKSDPVGINVDSAISTFMYVDTYVNAGASPVDTTKLWPLNYYLYPAWNEGKTINSNLTGAASAAPTVTGGLGNLGYGPCAIIGRVPLRKVVSVEGDSIITGQGDNLGGGTVDNQQDYGYIRRAFEAAGIPLVRISKPGDTLAGASGILGGRNRRALMNLSSCTDIISGLGINDIPTGTSFATMKSLASARWSAYAAAGIRVYAVTLTPRVDTTDYLKTLAGQTPQIGCGPNSVRTQYNDWIRSGAEGLIAGYFDVADVCETARNSGYWKIAVTNYTGIVSSATSNTITVSGTPWAVNEHAGKRVSIISGTGSPQSSSDLPRTIISNTANTLTLISGQAFVPSLDATSNFIIQTSLSDDGTHPSTPGAVAIAAIINTALFL